MDMGVSIEGGIGIIFGEWRILFAIQTVTTNNYNCCIVQDTTVWCLGP